MPEIPVVLLASLATSLLKANVINSTTLVDTATNAFGILTKQILASKKNMKSK